MTLRFIVRLRAERDIQSAYDRYEAQEPGLGEAFLEEVQKRLKAIRDFPESCPIIYRDVRRAVVSRFPYLVFYVVQPSRITVLAVHHHSRSPATWPRR